VYAFDKFFRRLAASLLFVFPAALALPAAALAATTVTGTVMNRTTDKPAAGDAVTLLKLVAGMQEVSSTTTNAHGVFTLSAPDDGNYLVRVTHDHATYFAAVTAGSKTVDLDVYNAAAHVVGVATEAIVIRAQTDASGGTLNVVQNFFVKNDSKPAMTQFSADPFDFYLPEGAVIEASAAMAPNGMPVSASPVPLAEKGRYAFLFPIRPGETRFQIAYHLPYTGTTKFGLKVAGLTDAFAVIIPKAMNFTPVAGTPFNPVNDDANAQTFVARKVIPGQPLGFQLTGTGQLPRDTPTGGQTGGQAGADQGGAPDGGGPATASSDTAPGKGLGVPLDPNGTNEPLATKYKWWILGALGLVLVCAAGILLRKPQGGHAVVAGDSVAVGTTDLAAAVRPAVRAGVPPVGGHREQLLQVLKEELFALETDRLQGHIAEPEYLQQKAAIEMILRRALGRGAAAGGGVPGGETGV
jgi:hypothetical protein